MTDDMPPDEARRRVAARTAVVLAVILGAAAFAGFLPGPTIFLGLLSSDPPLDVLRAAGAGLLALAAAGGQARDLGRAMTAVACASFLLAGWTLLDPRAGGALFLGVTPVESVTTAAFGALALAGARVIPSTEPREA